MTQSKTAKSLLVAMALAMVTSLSLGHADAAPPSVVQANMDYDASGYVVPAGMVPPTMYNGGVRPVGYYGSSCDSGGCESGFCGGGCDTGYYGGCEDCGGSCGCCNLLGSGGLLGKIRGQDNACGGMSNMRHMCLFCRGQGCSLCQSIGNAHHMWRGLGCLLPYCEQGICAQRWYDASLEGLFLGINRGGAGSPVTTLGVAPGVAGDPVPADQVVLSLGDIGSDDLEAGVRFSLALICGPGGNLEFTYLGANRWTNSATATDPAAGLYSFISDFGRLPIGGYDDTDRSIQQSLSATSEFHSGELNYRRRTVGPYCRFQGSWLVGLRFTNFRDTLTYSTLGEMDNAVNADLPRFFSSQDRIKNKMFGVQGGFDGWWNVCAGVNLGLGFKAAWVNNDVDRITTLTANSLAVGGPGVSSIDSGDQKSTVMGEFEMKLIYRFSHSWALRTSYYALAIDDIAFGTADAQTIDDFVNLNPLQAPALRYDSLVMQGFTLGAEYTW